MQQGIRLKGFLLVEVLTNSIIYMFLLITVLSVTGWMLLRFHEGIESYKIREIRYEQLEISIFGGD